MSDGDSTEAQPLKVAEQVATAEISAEAPAAVSPEKTPSEKAPAVAAPAVVSIEEAEPSSSATVTVEEKPKKKFTLPKPTFTPKYYKDVEYKNRDENNLHPDIRVNFSDVIAEPDGAHSFATVWGTSFKSYSVVKYWTYRILTAVLAVPISVFWGLYFALFAFCSIWCLVPCIKGFVIWTNFIGKIWGLVVRTFLDPLFESIGLCFTNIRVHLSMSTETVKQP